MISIVIPILNEADYIELLLLHLIKNASANNISEIIIVDGGSTDTSRAIVQKFKENSTFKIRLIASEKGRAKQMNAGAKAAKGNILYFLHADSFPPKNFDKEILRHIEVGRPSGCFRMKFDGKHPLLVFSQWFTRFNFKFCRGGDQSLFISKTLFESMGGFNEKYIIYEDCEFISRVYDNHRFYIIPKYVRTSSRKYKYVGVWRLQYRFAMIHLKYFTGAGPEELYAYYCTHIRSKIKAV